EPLNSAISWNDQAARSFHETRPILQECHGFSERQVGIPCLGFERSWSFAVSAAFGRRSRHDPSLGAEPASHTTAVSSLPEEPLTSATS
ncbi:hypothetical protein OAS86_04930, partial [Gammaproteobacteria bacterium]|nr:hypothetical protein [Gammaproteobacteria bacterium]